MEDVPARGIGQRMEQAVHLRRFDRFTYNHPVVDYGSRRPV
jgi:hypothetical protein